MICGEMRRAVELCQLTVRDTGPLIHSTSSGPDVAGYAGESVRLQMGQVSRVLSSRSIRMTIERSYDPRLADVGRILTRLQAQPDAAHRLLRFGNVLYREGKRAEAVAVYNLAASYAEPEVAYDLRCLRSQAAPAWHFRNINDAVRTRVFGDAIQQMVRPGDQVLEIGTGAGLLALMAAAAGAQRVTTCEQNPLIADIARAIVADNGYAETIHVIAKPSAALTVGEDLPEPAACLVADLFTHNLLPGKGLLAVREARQTLCMPAARSIPAAGAIRGCLVGGARLWTQHHVTDVAGFNLRRFNSFAPPVVPLAPDVFAVTPLAQYSSLVEFFHFDFHTLAGFTPAKATFTVTACKTGTVYGLLQWVWLKVAEGCIMDGAPQYGLQWMRYVHLFATPITVRTGETVCLTARHDLTTFHVWVSQT